MNNLLITADHTRQVCKHGENKFKKFYVDISEIYSLRCEDQKLVKYHFSIPFNRNSMGAFIMGKNVQNHRTLEKAGLRIIIRKLTASRNIL